MKQNTTITPRIHVQPSNKSQANEIIGPEPSAASVTLWNTTVIVAGCIRKAQCHWNLLPSTCMVSPNHTSVHRGSFRTDQWQMIKHFMSFVSRECFWFSWIAYNGGETSFRAASSYASLTAGQWGHGWEELEPHRTNGAQTDQNMDVDTRNFWKTHWWKWDSLLRRLPFNSLTALRCSNI